MLKAPGQVPNTGCSKWSGYLKFYSIGHSVSKSWPRPCWHLIEEALRKRAARTFSDDEATLIGGHWVVGLSLSLSTTTAAESTSVSEASSASTATAAATVISKSSTAVFSAATASSTSTTTTGPALARLKQCKQGKTSETDNKYYNNLVQTVFKDRYWPENHYGITIRKHQKLTIDLPIISCNQWLTLE